MRIHLIISAIFLPFIAVAYPPQELSISPANVPESVNDPHGTPVPSHPHHHHLHRIPARFRAPHKIVEVTIFLTTTVTRTRSHSSSSSTTTKSRTGPVTVTVTVKKTFVKTVWETTIIDTIIQSPSQEESSSTMESAIQSIMNNSSLSMPSQTSSIRSSSITPSSSAVTTSTSTSQQTESTKPSHSVAISKINFTISTIAPSNIQSRTENSSTTLSTTLTLKPSTFVTHPPTSIITLSTSSSQVPSDIQSKISGPKYISSSSSIGIKQHSSNKQSGTLTPSLSRTSLLASSFASVFSGSPVSAHTHAQGNDAFPGNHAGATLVVTPFLPPP